MSMVRKEWVLGALAAFIAACASASTGASTRLSTGQRCEPADPADPVELSAIMLRPIEASGALRSATEDTLLVAIAYDSTGALSRVQAHGRPGSQADTAAVATALRRHLRASGETRFFAYALLLRGEQPRLVPHSISRECPPHMVNAPEVSRLLRRLAGDGSLLNRSAVVWAYVNADGDVVRTKVNRSSGNIQLDLQLVEVARQARFAPAMLDDFLVPVWVSVPLAFRGPPPSSSPN
jgi:TonB family protein